MSAQYGMNEADFQHQPAKGGYEVLKTRNIREIPDRLGNSATLSRAQLPVNPVSEVSDSTTLCGPGVPEI